MELLVIRDLLTATRASSSSAVPNLGIVPMTPTGRYIHTKYRWAIYDGFAL